MNKRKRSPYKRKESSYSKYNSSPENKHQIKITIYVNEDTYKKIQSGPEDQRMSCGNPGINGGYFDNPEMRFGVTCVGQKPAQKKHDESEIAKGAPLSPDALAFDKKVNKFKSEADHIGINPFNTNKWSS